MKTLIDIQRHAVPDGRELEGHEATIQPVDVSGSALVRSALTELRDVRREPGPGHGVTSLIRIYLRNGVRAGWEDLLVSLARADRREYLRLRETLPERTPAGTRGQLMTTLSDAIAEVHPEAGAEETVESAAGELLAREEPFAAARAFEEAARARLRAGRRTGDLRRRAASIYRDIGADRALAALLRTSGWPKDLAEFQVPSSQFKRPSAGLTRRELEVAELARLGFTSSDIAAQLSISPHTAATHVKHLKRKLGIRRKSDLVRLRADG